MNNNRKKISKYLTLASLLFLILLSFSSSKPFSTVVLANIVIILGIIPIYIYIKKNNFDKLPILELQGIFYAITFGFVGLLEFERIRFISDEEINIALFYTIIGLICMYISYYYLSKKLVDKSIRPLQLSGIKLKIFDLKNLSFVYLVFFIIYDSIFKVDLSSFNFLLKNLYYFCLGISIFLFFKKKIKFYEKMLLILIIIYDILKWLIAGVLASFSSLLIFIVIIYNKIYRKIPLYIFFFLLVFFIYFQYVKVQYRDSVLKYNYRYTSIKKLENYTKIFIENYSSPIKGFSIALDPALNRIDHLGTTAIVISLSPGTVPYEYGNTYLPIFTKFIPRIVWKDKPQEITGNIWAKRYQLLHPCDYNTSYNLPWFTELYVNFGPLGIVFGMIFFGLFLRFLVNFFSIAYTELSFIFGLSLTYNFYGPESNFSLMIGNLFLSFISIYITLKILNFIILNKR